MKYKILLIFIINLLFINISFSDDNKNKEKFDILNYRIDELVKEIITLKYRVTELEMKLNDNINNNIKGTVTKNLNKSYKNKNVVNNNSLNKNKLNLNLVYERKPVNANDILYSLLLNQFTSDNLKIKFEFNNKMNFLIKKNSNNNFNLIYQKSDKTFIFKKMSNNTDFLNYIFHFGAIKNNDIKSTITVFEDANNNNKPDKNEKSVTENLTQILK
jgi:hypothetical protein